MRASRVSQMSAAVASQPAVFGPNRDTSHSGVTPNTIELDLLGIRCIKKLERHRQRLAHQFAGLLDTVSG